MDRGRWKRVVEIREKESGYEKGTAGEQENERVIHRGKKALNE